MSVDVAHIINILLKCQMLIRNYSACNAGILIIYRYVYHEICEMWIMPDAFAVTHNVHTKWFDDC